MKLTHEDLIVLLANRLDIQTSEAEESLNKWVDFIKTRIREKGSYRIAGLGRFFIENNKTHFEPEPALETEVNYKYAGMKPIEIHSSAANKKEISAKEAAEPLKDSEMADSNKEDKTKKSGDEEKKSASDESTKSTSSLKADEEKKAEKEAKQSPSASNMGKEEEKEKKQTAPAKKSTAKSKVAEDKKKATKTTRKPAAAKEKPTASKDSIEEEISGPSAQKEGTEGKSVKEEEKKTTSQKSKDDESVKDKSSGLREGVGDKKGSKSDEPTDTDFEDLPGITSKEATKSKPFSRWRGKKEPEKMESDPFESLDERPIEKPREDDMDNTDVFGIYDDDLGKEKAEPLVKKNSGSGKKSQSRSVVSGSGPGKIRSRRGGMPTWLWILPIVIALGLGVYLYFYYTDHTFDIGQSTADLTATGTLEAPEETYIYEDVEEQPAVVDEDGAVPDVTDDPVVPDEAEPDVVTDEPVEPVEEPPVQQDQVTTPERSTEYGLRGSIDDVLTGSFSIVVHSIPSEARARSERDRLSQAGYKATIWQNELPDGGVTWRVGLGQFESIANAERAIPELEEPFRSNNFIARIR